MLVLITYDVDTTTKAGEKRLRKVAKECVNYGQRVQNSVFECLLTEAQLVNLKAILSSIINDTTDSIRIYHLGSNWQRKIETLGKITSFDPTDTLIV
jgi:CRISPR-associated protein Cas2